MPGWGIQICARLAFPLQGTPSFPSPEPTAPLAWGGEGVCDKVAPAGAGKSKETQESFLPTFWGLPRPQRLFRRRAH